METISWAMFNLHALKASEAKRMWRQSIFDRDGNHCVYCGDADNLTIDHVRPRSKGGETTAANCVTACRQCNHAKGSMSLADFHTMIA